MVFTKRWNRWRSYIVNMDKVDKVRFSEGIIELFSGDTVLLSKSLKKSIREYQKSKM